MTPSDVLPAIAEIVATSLRLPYARVEAGSNPVVGDRPQEHLIVGGVPQVDSFPHGDDIMLKITQGGRDRWRIHLVEYESWRLRLIAHAMRRRCRCHACSARTDASSAAAISASISSP